MSSIDVETTAQAGSANLIVGPLAALGPAVDSVLADADLHGVAFVRRLCEEWASGANRFNRPGEAFLGAWDGNRLVGLGGLNRDPYATQAETGRLRHVYVLGSHRRRGIGVRLVRRLLREAEGHFRVVRLRAASPDAAAFYRSVGFADCAGPDATHIIPVEPTG